MPNLGVIVDSCPTLVLQSSLVLPSTHLWIFTEGVETPAREAQCQDTSHQRGETNKCFMPKNKSRNANNMHKEKIMIPQKKHSTSILKYDDEEIDEMSEKEWS